MGLRSIILIFLSLFFIRSGPKEWGTNSNIRFTSVIVFGIGYFIIQSRRKKSKKDEHEFQIELKSRKASMVFIF